VLSQLGQRLQLWGVTYPGGTRTALTNDLMTYMGLDVDLRRNALVTARREASAVLWVGDATGASGAEITGSYPPGTVGYPARVAWAGTRVLYDTRAGGASTIMAVPAEGGTPTELVADATHFAVSPDGRTIVHSREPPNGLWTNDGSGRPSVPLLTGELAANPLFTRDGQKLIFVGARSGIQTPWVMPLDGGEAVEIVRKGVGVGAQTVDVSPDGSRLVLYTTNEVGQPSLLVCDWPSCSNPRDLTVPPDFDAPIRWTPDGQAIAFVSHQGANISALPLEGGPPRPITQFRGTATRRRISDYAWSNDGRLAVAFVTMAEDIVLISGLNERASGAE
jgi:dipeptidyl aminopeptidase/acylaminoacyl peptidase